MTSTGGTSSDARPQTSVQIDEDMPFQRRTWAVERGGWIAMAALVAAALLGLFSVGPLSSATSQDPEGLIRVEYDRFQRYLAPTTLRVSLSKPAASGETVSIRLSRSLLDALRIERIEPQPEQAAATADGLLFTFRIDAADGPGTAIFSLKPNRIGAIRGEIGLAGHEPIRLTPFVYP